MTDLIEGVVIEKDGETAKVRTSVHSDCENCGVCPGSNAMIIDALDRAGAKLGDNVLIENQKSHMLLAAFMIYIFPLLAVGGGIILGNYLAFQFNIASSLMMTLGGVVFGVAALFIIKLMDKKLQAEIPIIVKTVK